MTRDHLGVDGRVADTETEDAPHSELRIQDSGRVLGLAHRARPKRMVQRLGPVPDDLTELLVAQPVQVVIEQRVLVADVGQVRQGRRVRDLVRPTDAANQRVEIVFGGEVAVEDVNGEVRTRKTRLTLDR